VLIIRNARKEGDDSKFSGRAKEPNREKLVK
jgi:hypothetical protein